MNIIQIDIPSTNYDSSRKPIKQVVIHWMVGTLMSTDIVFRKLNSTSAHYGVEDYTVHQYVNEANTAYAVGNYARNQETISIEHSAAPDRPASDITYRTSGRLIYEICKRNNIPIDREHIIKHSEIVATQCPGTMDLDKLIKIAKSHVVVTPPPAPAPPAPPAPDYQKGSGKFDKVVQQLHEFGLLPSDSAPNYYENDDVRNAIQKLKELQGNPDTQNKLNQAKSLGKQIADL